MRAIKQILYQVFFEHFPELEGKAKVFIECRGLRDPPEVRDDSDVQNTGKGKGKGGKHPRGVSRKHLGRHMDVAEDCLHDGEPLLKVCDDI